VTFSTVIITFYQRTLLGTSVNQKRHYLKSYNNCYCTYKLMQYSILQGTSRHLKIEMVFPNYLKVVANHHRVKFCHRLIRRVLTNYFRYIIKLIMADRGVWGTKSALFNLMSYNKTVNDFQIRWIQGLINAWNTIFTSDASVNIMFLHTGLSGCCFHLTSSIAIVFPGPTAKYLLDQLMFENNTQ
jgi:hypothetical protein